MLDNLYSEIMQDIGLKSEEEIAKVASNDTFIDPLSAQIAQFLADNPDDSDVMKEASAGSELVVEEPTLDFDDVAGISEQRSTPTSLSATLIDIEKQAGQQIFPDGIKRFVYNAEKQGASREDIEGWLESNMGNADVQEAINKEAGYGALGAGLGLLGKAISAPIAGVVRGAKAKSARKAALNSIYGAQNAPQLADARMADAVRKAGSGIQEAESLSDRLISVINPGHFKKKRIAEELKVSGLLDDIRSADPDFFWQDPKRLTNLVNEVTYGAPVSDALRPYVGKKFRAPTDSVSKIKSDLLAQLSPSERAAAGIGSKWDAFKKGNRYKPTLAGAGGAGLAYLAATRDRGQGGGGGGRRVLVV